MGVGKGNTLRHDNTYSRTINEVSYVEYGVVTPGDIYDVSTVVGAGNLRQRATLSTHFVLSQLDVDGIDGASQNLLVVVVVVVVVVVLVVLVVVIMCGMSVSEWQREGGETGKRGNTVNTLRASRTLTTISPACGRGNGHEPMTIVEEGPVRE